MRSNNRKLKSYSTKIIEQFEVMMQESVPDLEDEEEETLNLQ